MEEANSTETRNLFLTFEEIITVYMVLDAEANALPYKILSLKESDYYPKASIERLAIVSSVLDKIRDQIPVLKAKP